MDPKQNPLMEKMQSFNERYSLLHPKPQNLPFDQIVSRVADFMKSQERDRAALSFGNEVGESLDDENDARFDPIALYDADPDKLGDIIMFVEHDMSWNEQELLSRKNSSLYAYNTLVFGAAIRLSREEELSRELRAFLVDHLITPNPPKKAKKPGRPKLSTDNKLFRILAIKFAKEHGLTATRNDVTEVQESACDAVCVAALKIYQTEKKSEYATGYSYESLKKIWHEGK